MAMVAEKAERLLNLVILLLVARNYTTKEQIRALMEPYRASSDEAFDRMFERDKDELRALGIPLETGFVDKFFEDEVGYRIERDAFELPAVDFTADFLAARRALGDLPDDMRGLCAAFGTCAVPEIVSRTGISRSALYRHIARLRLDLAMRGFGAEWDGSKAA